MRESDLARGIIHQAVRDFLTAIRPIHKNRAQTLEVATRARIRTLTELRKFFKSRWCAALMDDAMDTQDGAATAAKILDALEKRYIRSKAAVQIRLYKEQGITKPDKKSAYTAATARRADQITQEHHTTDN